MSIPYASTSENANIPYSSQLNGLNVVVTSGASLLGRAVCLELAAQGANLAITDFSKAEGQELCLEIQNSGHKGNLVLSTFDPKDSARLASFVRGVAKTFKTVHAIVNCATWSPEENLLHRTRLETMTEILDTNVKTAWTATQAAIAQFESQTEAKLQHPVGGYAIVNIVSGLDSNDHITSYQMARQAIQGLTQSVACEYGNADIRANMITAGACEVPDVATSFVKQIFTSVSQVKEKIPMRRLGNPSEVAKVAAFLLSPASSYVTGANIPVDGGFSAKRT